MPTGVRRAAFAQVFGSPLPLNAYATSDQGIDVTPRIVTDGAGTWIVGWHGGAGDVLFTRSTDVGGTWTSAAALNPTPATRGGGVQLATDGTTWVAVWGSGGPVGGGDGDVLTARSLDGGVTWSSPQLLNTNGTTDSALDTSPYIATDGAGVWITAWTSIGTDSDIFFARSTDGGATWTAPAPLNANAGVDSAFDDEPQLATDGGGTWIAVWTSHDPLGGLLGSDADILVARSVDGGVTWSAPLPLNTDAPSDVGDDYFPAVASDANGTWIAVWTSTDSLGGTIGSDEDILFARSTDSGATWSAPAALNANAADDFGNDAEPQLATDGHGTWVVVWYGATLGSRRQSDDDARMARSTDGGVTWSLPLPLNDDAAHEKGFESDPTVATDGAGNWIVVWDAQKALGGSTGIDFDILVARGRAITCTPAPAVCAPVAPAPGSTLLLKDKSPDRGDGLAWTWRATTAPALADLGAPASTDPLDGTSYRLCIYDGGSTLRLGAAIPAGGRCGRRACWTASPGVGFGYRDVERTPEGVDRVQLEAGDSGDGRIVVKGKGERLAMPALGSLVFPVRVQLQADGGGCWETTFATPTVSTTAVIRAKSP